MAGEVNDLGYPACREFDCVAVEDPPTEFVDGDITMLAVSWGYAFPANFVTSVFFVML